MTARQHRSSMEEGHFKVTWVCDVWADTPEEAAKRAHELQQKPTTATFFTVREYIGQCLSGAVIEVDLDELEEPR